MNQTKKRLSIINLAISIGDTETIQLQILKLSPLKRDEKIQKIIHTLQAENYAQAQTLITSYIEHAPDEIHQRTLLETSNSQKEDEAIIEEFDLFRTKQEEEHEEIDEILDLDNSNADHQEETPEEKSDFDALLNLKSEEVLPNTLQMQQTLSDNDDFFSLPEENEQYNYTEVVEKDDFFFQDTQDDVVKSVETEKEEADHTSSAYQSDSPVTKAAPDNVNTVPDESFQIYEPIPYIDQKFKNMQTQYPPVEESSDHFPSVDAWLKKIANEGYEEHEIEEMVIYIEKLVQENKKAEAAQLLLISAATQSKYAQFMLARALFKGDIVKKNLPEAFTLINRLAMDDDYAEAICDLGQFYEHGIGIDKDTHRAEVLYKEAMELGISRAKRHYERLSKANKGVLGKLFGK